MQDHSNEFPPPLLQLNAEFSRDTGTLSSHLLHSEQEILSQSLPLPKDSSNLTNGQEFLVEAL